MCVFLPTAVLAHEAGGRVGLRGRTPAVSLPRAFGVAVLPTLLLQLLKPVMHHLSAGGLETSAQTHSYSHVGDK